VDGNRRLDEAQDAASHGEVFDARDAFSLVEKHWPPSSECVKKAREKLATLRTDVQAKRVFSVEKTWNDALAAEIRDPARAATLYAKCAKAASGTPFAEDCEKKAKDLAGKSAPASSDGR
jgi:hypothetical protein